MDFAPFLTAIARLLENWPFWIVFTASLLSVIQPRWFWDENDNVCQLRAGGKPEPSALWLFNTRIAGLVFMVMVVLAVCYGQTEP